MCLVGWVVVPQLFSAISYNSSNLFKLVSKPNQTKKKSPQAKNKTKTEQHKDKDTLIVYTVFKYSAGIVIDLFSIWSFHMC